MLAVARIALALVAPLAFSTSRAEGELGARESREQVAGDTVLYTIGVSTDPYGRSSPGGFGVVRGLAGGEPRRVELRSRAYGWFGGAEWLDRGRILVQRRAPPLRPPEIFRMRSGRLERIGTAPFTSGSQYGWSRDWRRVAWEPPAPCRRGQRSLFRCYRGSGRIYVANGDGRDARLRANGTLGGWTRDGRLVFYRTRRDATSGRAVLLDLDSGRIVVRSRYWISEQPLASADGRYLVQRRKRARGTTIEVSTRGRRVVQRIPSRYLVSMLAWSPRGHRLAYTTSGFPDPHELYVVDAPGRKPRRIFATGAPHFDWVTWSPDGRWLLLDADRAGGWRLFSAATGRQVRVLPRLGGALAWCCPQGRYSALGRGRSSE